MAVQSVKPKIEDVASNVLSGEVLKNALDFVAYLRDNKLNPIWSAQNAWKVSSKTFTVCFIRLYGAAEYHGLSAGEWNITPFIGEYGADDLSAGNKKIALDNKKNCSPCGICALQLDKIFGEKFPTACEASIHFHNPNSAAVECAKEIVALRKNEIKEGRAAKHKYVALQDR